MSMLNNYFARVFQVVLCVLAVIGSHLVYAEDRDEKKNEKRSVEAGIHGGGGYGGGGYGGSG